MSLARRLDRLEGRTAPKRQHVFFGYVEHVVADAALQGLLAAKGIEADPGDDYVVVQSFIAPRAGEPPVVHVATT